jgi:hypothetical protein
VDNEQQDQKEGEEQPKQDRYAKYETAAHWLRWLRDAKRSAEDEFWCDVKPAYREYYKDVEDLTETEAMKNSTVKRFPIFWSSIQTVAPAYYSQTPKTIAKVRFDIEDDVARTGAKITERLSEYLLDLGPFDDVMKASVLDFLVADRACTRVILEEREAEVEVKTPIQIQYDAAEEPHAYLQDGTEVFGIEALPDEQGGFYYISKGKEVRRHIVPVAVPYDEILHTPQAKSQDEITEVAFKFSLPEDDAREMFPEAQNLPLKSAGTDDKEDKDKVKSTATKYLEGWEIWCLTTKKVYWVCEDYKEGVLRSEDDPYNLRNFFPCTKFFIGTKRRKSMYGRPAYIQLRGLINQIHETSERLRKLINAARRRALADGTVKDLMQLIQSDENEFIFVPNLNQIIEKGGLGNLIQYLPMAELNEAISQMAQLIDRFKQEFFELYGVPDVVRGSSDPMETLGAQQIKTQSLGLRFSYPIGQVGELARDTIELMIDLSLNAYTDDELAQKIGVQHMAEADVERYGQSIQFLRSDEERVVRVDIETDSTSRLTETIDQQNRNVAVQTVMGGLQQVASMAQHSPQFIPVALKTILMSLSSMRAGKDFEDEVKAAVDALMESQSQPQQPPPDYEGMKLQLKQQELAMKQQKQAHEIQLQQMESAVEQRMASFKQWLETQLLGIEKQKADVSAQETFAEEARLARESQARAIEAQQPKAPSAPSTLIVNNSAPAPAQPQPAPVIAPVIPEDPYGY